MRRPPTPVLLIRFAAALTALFGALIAGPTAAAPLGRIDPSCFVVGDARAPASDAGCTPLPRGYQSRWLWLTLDAPPAGAPWRVTVRQSRFDQAVAEFRYADGATVRHAVSSGYFGSHWRIGGKIAFDPPLRAAPVTRVALGFERLAAHDLLRIRLTRVDTADRAEERTTLIAGAAFALLFFAAAYNLGIGIGARRRFALWHAGWAGCVLGWGLLWTQAALLIWPALAGSPSVGLSIFLSSAAISCAGAFFVAALEPGMLPRRAGRALEAQASLVALLGLVGGCGPRVWMPLIGDLLGVAVLAAAASLAFAIAIAVRAGSRSARDFALSWVLPIAAVIWTFVTDRGLTADDDSGQLLVLAVCALQTVGLSLIVGYRLASVRQERHAARAREAHLQALADTDPLTGVYNRRGFIARAEAALADERPTVLILLDLDHFKAVNDSFGHDTGDRVLLKVANLLRGHAGDAIVGRLGGEEFGVCVGGPIGPAPNRLAERLRRSIAALDHGGTPRQVTASFGVAEGHAGFETMYRDADRALYRAKALGRDRVEMAEPETAMSLAG